MKMKFENETSLMIKKLIVHNNNNPKWSYSNRDKLAQTTLTAKLQQNKIMLCIWGKYKCMYAGLFL